MRVCLHWRKTESLKAARLCLMCLSSFMTLSTHKNSRSLLVFLGWTGTDPAAPTLKTCPSHPLAIFFSVLCPLSVLPETELFMGKWGWICVILHAWITSWCPSILSISHSTYSLTELLSELSLSVTLHRKKKKVRTTEPQLVITTWRAMGLCLSPSPLEPFEDTP